MSEAATVKDIFAPFCIGLGLDIGFGGDAIVPHAITFDKPQPYTKVGNDPQIMRGDCRDLSMFCDNTLNWIASCHLLEDFAYDELAGAIIPEWRRVLRKGGVIVTNCPTQIKFLQHCALTGQPLNLAHLEPDFSQETFQRRVMDKTGPWELIFEKKEHGAYSWLTVHRKI